jgi:phosphocarrier protein
MRVHEFPISSEFKREDLIGISAKSSQFVSDIKIIFTHDHVEHTVDVKSLLGMLLLPINPGTMIRLITKGKDEEEALEFIYRLFDKHL